MPVFDWDAVPETVNQFGPPPTGNYLVEVAKVDVSYHADKENPEKEVERWNLWLVIQEGQYQGRRLYANWWWNAKGLPEIKSALKAFGLDLRGQQEVTPDMLIRMQAVAHHRVFKRKDGQDGCAINKYSPAPPRATPF